MPGLRTEEWQTASFLFVTACPSKGPESWLRISLSPSIPSALTSHSLHRSLKNCSPPHRHVVCIVNLMQLIRRWYKQMLSMFKAEIHLLVLKCSSRYHIFCHLIYPFNLAAEEGVKNLIGDFKDTASVMTTWKELKNHVWFSRVVLFHVTSYQNGRRTA